jgi:hypothetical protein
MNPFESSTAGRPFADKAVKAKEMKSGDVATVYLSILMGGAAKGPTT